MMTPLEAAKALAEDRFGQCPVCFERLWPMASAPAGAPELERGSHKPNCPVLQLPQIVAALEEAAVTEQRRKYWFERAGWRLSIALAALNDLEQGNIEDAIELLQGIKRKSTTNA